MKTAKIVHHTIFPDLLSAESIVVDLGANLGDFANAMASRFQCRVYSVEASPQVFDKITAGNLVRKFNFAVCGKSGPVTLNISSNPEATSLKKLNNSEYIDAISVPGLTLEDFLKTISVSEINLLKFDIEGAEIEVFSSCPDVFLQSIDQITVEFHEWVGVSTKLEVENVVRRLRALGFYVFKMTRIDYSDVLFVNHRRMSRVGHVTAKLLILVQRTFRYIRRRAKLK